MYLSEGGNSFPPLFGSFNTVNKMQKSHGFTLIELMIVIAIIGILASLAVPQYGQYTKRAKYSEVVTATVHRKTAVSLCYQETNAFTTCNGAGNVGDSPTIPRDLVAGTGLVASAITAAGVITATGSNEVDGKTYVLTPTRAGLSVEWENTGTCLQARLCR